MEHVATKHIGIIFNSTQNWIMEWRLFDTRVDTDEHIKARDKFEFLNWIYRRGRVSATLDALGFHPHVLDMSDDKMIESLFTHLRPLYIVIHGLGPLIELSSKHIQLPRGSQINPLSSTFVWRYILSYIGSLKIYNEGLFSEINMQFLKLNEGLWKLIFSYHQIKWLQKCM